MLHIYWITLSGINFQGYNVRANDIFGHQYALLGDMVVECLILVNNINVGTGSILSNYFVFLGPIGIMSS